MINRQALLDAARACVGTPFKHQGRLPRVGLDCIGLLVVAAKSQGIPHVDRRAYPRRPDGHTLLRMLREQPCLVELPCFESALPGDVLVLEFIGKTRPQHVGMKTENGGIIHTDGTRGKVSEHGLDASLLGHITHAFTWVRPD